MQHHIGQTSLPNNKHKVLITKLLPKKESARLAARGLLVKELSFIKKKSRTLEYQTEDPVNAIFTSVQAVKSLRRNNFDFGQINQAFCVGRKTVNVLARLGVKVGVEANNARELAEIIAAKYRQQKFVAFTGNLRRDELYTIFGRHRIKVDEVVVYDTVILKRLLGEQFARVVFFSPSGVQGYVRSGNNTHAEAYCLGATTGEEAGKYFNRVHIAPEPNVKSLIDYLIADIENHA